MRASSSQLGAIQHHQATGIAPVRLDGTRSISSEDLATLGEPHRPPQPAKAHVRRAYLHVGAGLHRRVELAILRGGRLFLYVWTFTGHDATSGRPLEVRGCEECALPLTDMGV